MVFLWGEITLAKVMKRAAVLCASAALLFILLYIFNSPDLWLTPAVTAATFAYHLVMRLAVGGVYDRLLHNRVNCRRRWFCPRFFEADLYRLLRVKEWKDHLPTYDPKTFSPQLHSWEEIAQATCQSELVHETIMVLSFVPVLAINHLGSAGVFWATSAISACFDSLFVITQRYNRFRLIKIIDRQTARRTK